jgi:hypothetical protein
VADIFGIVTLTDVEFEVIIEETFEAEAIFEFTELNIFCKVYAVVLVGTFCRVVCIMFT